ncbi:MAG: CocE/NonD family hydrolase [Planctomycetes bacterium]|nr:CocE/NonD family hydrolase [Planctomycetota bacterium]
MMRRRPLIRSIVLTLLATTLAAASVSAQRSTLSGKVTDEKTGRPIAGIALGVARVSKLRAEQPADPIKWEKKLTTDKEGRFEMKVGSNLEGLNEVILFTASEDHANQIYKGLTFEGQVPRLKDVQRDGVVKLDLTKDCTGIDFVLRSQVATGMRNVMVPMRDGTKLATDIYLPEGDGPWPAILSRTPYNKTSNKNKRGARSLARNGYAVVAQDFRGRFASEGETDMPFINDGWGKLQDGYDTIEWIVKQPWCNGKVGTSGGSALGITQIMTAGSTPPHLVCQSIGVACGSLYHHAAWQGGAFRKKLVEQWLTGNKFSPDCLKLMTGNPNYNDLWRGMDASTRSEVINVPGFFQGGWYDVFNQGTIDAFMWRQYKGGEGARGKQKLLMGPWVHGRNRKPGEVQFPENAVQIPKAADQGRWFDYWLKGEQNGIMDEPAVTYYVMGDVSDPKAPGNEWRFSDVWPVPSKATPYYIHADGTLSMEKPPADGKSKTYTYDPKKPVPTLGGCNLCMKKGPYDQRKLENRPDVLLYTTVPLTQPVEVTGQIKAYLWASSSCRDTDFTVKLTDVYPDGRSMLVLDGIIRARHRNTFEKDELLTPGEIYKFKIDLWSTSLIFNKGHRIRVAVSSSNYPRWDPNPNTGDGFRANDKTIVAENTIYHDAEHPSHILLPVVEAK